MHISGNVPLSGSFSPLPVEPGGPPQTIAVATADKLLSVGPAASTRVWQLASIGLQLSLLALVIHQFEIESAAFFQLTVLTFAGFIVHSVLPLRHRLPFFAVLSLAGIGLVLGLNAGAVLVTIGLILIGICHLPVPFSVRVTILLLAGAALALLRVEWIPSPWSMAIWPILGSMFMFRLCVYLYDLKHDKEPPSVARTVSYFFLLPNVCFPLFPVIDYKTFRRTYYNEDAFQIYQNGVRWMFRGIVQLVLYRFVYHHLTITPAEVSEFPDLVRYLTSNFLLYLRVSGSFHLIVGMLHLFGFNLPPTHYLFYLASSFNDFWRRINIYWKDFMMKLFYYPAYFKLRRFGASTALVVSTFFVFFSTWLLHSYQWFWLRGSFPLNWQDGLFWGVLAVLVVVNSLYEAKHGRARTLGRHLWTPASLAGRSVRTIGTFCTICVLWSLWTSESFSEWTSLWSLPGGWGVAESAAPITLLLLGAFWFGGLTGTASRSATSGAPSPNPNPTGFARSVVLTSLSLVALYAVGHPAVHSRLGATGEIVESVRSPRLNTQDASRLEAGYYEGLLRVDRFNSQLWEVYMRNPSDVGAWEGTGRTVRATNDFRIKELRPNLRTHLSGRPFSTNQWGLRDREYSVSPSPSTRRIALMGSSIIMGSGVSDGENFESLLEARLNREYSPNTSLHYEILNFSVGGYGPLEQMVALERRVFSFQPQAVFYVAHYSDTKRAINHLINAVARGLEPPYDDLRRIAREAEIDATTPETVAQARLRPFGSELVSFAYRRIAAECRARGIAPVWIVLPDLGDENFDKPSDALIRLASAAGFHVLDLSDVYAGFDQKRIRVSEADSHPNTDGHRIIEERIYRELKDLDGKASLGLFASKASAQ